MYTKSELIVMPIALFVMICVAIGLRIWLKNKSEKIQNIPFIVITALLWVGKLSNKFSSSRLRTAIICGLYPCIFAVRILYGLRWRNLRAVTFKNA